ncbi:hypothetical protein DFJ73DRAFT_414321 [Zopfochytrium polystomum]|nr:hypothetical protein DFJ73DRAFT_414321 [Zopfochytrium polystomum]
MRLTLALFLAASAASLASAAVPRPPVLESALYRRSDEDYDAKARESQLAAEEAKYAKEEASLKQQQAAETKKEAAETKREKAASGKEKALDTREKADKSPRPRWRSSPRSWTTRATSSRPARRS